MGERQLSGPDRTEEENRDAMGGRATSLSAGPRDRRFDDWLSGQEEEAIGMVGGKKERQQ